MSDQHHFIRHTHDRDTIEVSFECTAHPSADCHRYKDCDCGAGCEHDPYTHDECGFEAWMNDYCARECFDGERGEPVRAKAPILVRFNGDCVEWEYAS